MTNELITTILLTDFTEQHLIEFINIIDHEFCPPLSGIKDINDWATKLFHHASVIVAYTEMPKQIVGVLAFYANDHKKSYAYVPIVGVLKEFRGKGLSKLLFGKCFQMIKETGIAKVGIRTWEGSIASLLYENIGFEEKARIQDRPNGGYTIYFEKTFY